MVDFLEGFGMRKQSKIIVTDLDTGKIIKELRPYVIKEIKGDVIIVEDQKTSSKEVFNTNRYHIREEKTNDYL